MPPLFWGCLSWHHQRGVILAGRLCGPLPAHDEDASMYMWSHLLFSPAFSFPLLPCLLFYLFYPQIKEELLISKSVYLFGRGAATLRSKQKVMLTPGQFSFEEVPHFVKVTAPRAGLIGLTLDTRRSRIRESLSVREHGHTPADHNLVHAQGACHLRIQGCTLLAARQTTYSINAGSGSPRGSSGSNLLKDPCGTLQVADCKIFGGKNGVCLCRGAFPAAPCWGGTVLTTGPRVTTGWPSRSAATGARRTRPPCLF